MALLVFPMTPEGKFNTGAINTNETMKLKLEYLGQGRMVLLVHYLKMN